MTKDEFAFEPMQIECNSEPASEPASGTWDWTAIVAAAMTECERVGVGAAWQAEYYALSYDEQCRVWASLTDEQRWALNDLSCDDATPRRIERKEWGK